MASADFPLVYQALRPGAQAPIRSRTEDAGFDLAACLPEPGDMAAYVNKQHDKMTDGAQFGYASYYNKETQKNSRYFIIPPGSRAMVPTGLAMACPDDTVLKICPRSGWARDQGVEILAGVGDSGYRNEYFVLVKNGGLKPLRIFHGDRIAQVLPLKLTQTNLLHFTKVYELPASSRGGKGFGSSGQ